MDLGSYYLQFRMLYFLKIHYCRSSPLGCWHHHRIMPITMLLATIFLSKRNTSANGDLSSDNTVSTEKGGGTTVLLLTFDIHTSTSITFIKDGESSSLWHHGSSQKRCLSAKSKSFLMMTNSWCSALPFIQLIRDGFFKVTTQIELATTLKYKLPVCSPPHRQRSMRLDSSCGVPSHGRGIRSCGDECDVSEMIYYSGKTNILYRITIERCNQPPPESHFFGQ